MKTTDETEAPEPQAELEQDLAQKIETAVWEILNNTQAEPRTFARLAAYIEKFIANPGFSLTDSEGKRNSDLDEPYMRLRNSLGKLFLEQKDGLVIPDVSNKQIELRLLATELRMPAILLAQINKAVSTSIREQNADSSVVNSLIRGLEDFLVDTESPSLTRDNQAELTLLTDVAEKFPVLMPMREDGLPGMEVTTPKQRAIVRFVISALRDNQNAVTAESETLDNTVTNQETASIEQVGLTSEVKENIDRVVANRYGPANLFAMNNTIGLLEVLVPFLESEQVADENKDYTEEKEELQNLAQELSDYFDTRSEIPALYPNHNTLYKYLLARIAKTEIFNPLKNEYKPLVEYIGVSEIQDKLQEWIEEFNTEESVSEEQVKAEDEEQDDEPIILAEDKKLIDDAITEIADEKKLNPNIVSQLITDLYNGFFNPESGEYDEENHPNSSTYQSYDLLLEIARRLPTFFKIEDDDTLSLINIDKYKEQYRHLANQLAETAGVTDNQSLFSWNDSRPDSLAEPIKDEAAT